LQKSYLADLLAGFDLLHIDPIKDPHISGIIPMETVIQRTIEIIEYVESERTGRNLPPIAYEVGTEETNGGLTSENEYGEFIKTLTERLKERGLPIPDFIVGQTGTLTRLTENVGRFDASTARKLSMKAGTYGVGLKEHNADYLSDFILYMHPVLGITAANVAPEFGVAETGAYFLMSEIETDLYKRGMLREKSDLKAMIREKAVKSERWRKWMLANTGELPIEKVMNDEGLVETITKTAGHYTFDIPAVRSEIKKLFRNLESIGMKPESILINSIKKSIERYVDCFNLAGLTSKIIGMKKVG
jgi:D-tagatose-1,6-bisphosphate aldolase subunit GatZ/KbaZ